MFDQLGHFSVKWLVFSLVISSQVEKNLHSLLKLTYLECKVSLDTAVHHGRVRFVWYSLTLGIESDLGKASPSHLYPAIRATHDT